MRSLSPLYELAPDQPSAPVAGDNQTRLSQKRGERGEWGAGRLEDSR